MSLHIIQHACRILYLTVPALSQSKTKLEVYRNYVRKGLFPWCHIRFITEGDYLLLQPLFYCIFPKKNQWRTNNFLLQVLGCYHSSSCCIIHFLLTSEPSKSKKKFIKFQCKWVLKWLTRVSRIVIPNSGILQELLMACLQISCIYTG